jgi:hypothetical protein
MNQCCFCLHDSSRHAHLPGRSGLHVRCILCYSMQMRAKALLTPDSCGMVEHTVNGFATWQAQIASQRIVKHRTASRIACSVRSRLRGTLSSAAVPVAPTPGGKPYSNTATLRSSACLRRSVTQLLMRAHRRRTRSRMRKILPATRPPRGTVSMAPSSSGNEYSTCKNAKKFECVACCTARAHLQSTCAMQTRPQAHH